LKKRIVTVHGDDGMMGSAWSFI